MHTAGMCEARRDLGRWEGGVAAPSLSPKIREAAAEVGAPGGGGSPRGLPGARSWLLPLDDVCNGAGEHQEPLRHLQGHWKRKETSAGISPRQDLTPVGSPKKTEKLGKRAVAWHRPPRPRAHPELASRPFLNPLTPPVRPASRGNKLEVLITCRAGKRRFPSVYFKPAPHHANVRPRCKEEGIIIP